MTYQEFNRKCSKIEAEYPELSVEDFTTAAENAEAISSTTFSQEWIDNYAASLEGLVNNNQR